MHVRPSAYVEVCGQPVRIGLVFPPGESRVTRFSSKPLYALSPPRWPSGMGFFNYLYFNKYSLFVYLYVYDFRAVHLVLDEQAEESHPWENYFSISWPSSCLWFPFHLPMSVDVIVHVFLGQSYVLQGDTRLPPGNVLMR